MTNWYTAKGDEGKTTLLGQKLEKDSLIFDILGVLDELQCYLGVCKSNMISLKEEISKLQNSVFKIQAEVATKRHFTILKDISYLEDKINLYGQNIKINSFILTSSDASSAHLDYARTLARKAERAFYIYGKDFNPKYNTNSLKYLNRLSSLLFVMSKHFDTQLEKVNYK